MRTYLSIDLDYWRTSGTPDRFFRRVFNLGLPIFVCPFHEQLLPRINQSGCDRLINVDAHADIVDDPCPLEEGTWANFVTWRHQGAFEWRYRSEDDLAEGYCHGYENPFQVDCCGWKRVTLKCGLGGIPWKAISSVGVCLSTAWLEDAPVGKIVDRLGITRWTRMNLVEQRLHAEPFFYTAA